MSIPVLKPRIRRFHDDYAGRRAGLAVSSLVIQSSPRSVPSPRPANIERLLIACVFVLLAGGLFPGAKGDDDIMRGSSLAQLLWGIVYVGAVVGLLRHRDKLSQLMRLSLPIIAIVALALISTAWSIDPSITLRRALGLFGTTAFAYYVVSRFKLEDFVDIFGLTCCVVIALSLLAVFFVPSIGVMQKDYAGAWRGIFSHKNGLGGIYGPRIRHLCDHSAF